MIRGLARAMARARVRATLRARPGGYHDFTLEVALYRIQCLMDSFEKGKVAKATVKTCKEQNYKAQELGGIVK